MVLRGGLISIDRVGSRVSGLGWVIVAAGLGASAIAGGGCWGRSAPTPPAATTAPAAAPLPPLPPSVRPTPPSPPASGVTPKVQPSREALALSDAFANAAAAIRPSVVRLDVEGLGDPSSVAESGEHPPDKPDFLHRLLGRGQAPKHRVPIHGTGSGILLDGKGDILTNSHVVAGADKVTIKLSDQRSFIGRVIGTDPLTDVGVVKFEKAPAGLVAARLG